jgi:hypothetical protein
MITLEKFLEATQYKITDGSKFDGTVMEKMPAF